MTSPTSFDMTDSLIERMLAERAGPAAPGGFAADVMAAVKATPQRRGFLPRMGTLPPRSTGSRALMAAAAVTIALLAVAGGMIVGALLRPPTQRLDPAPVPIETATAAPSASPIPTESTGPTVSVNGPLVVHQFRETFIDLFTLDPFSGRKVMLGNLQKTSEAAGQSIHLSADRKRAFVFADSDSVQVMADIATGAVEPLGLVPGGGRDAVSPAGDLVARLEGDTESGSSVSMVDLDGNEVLRTPLPAGMQAFLELAWSPDGTAVLVSGCLPCDEPPGTRHDYLYSVPVDGGAPREVADSTTGSFGMVGWSPDMATIAFSDAQCATTCTGGIGTVRVRDGLVNHLTDADDGSPAWSPDGTRIAFTRDGSEGRGIYVIDADGSNLARLTSASTDRGDRSPLWSPDGAWLVFSRETSGLGDLYIVSSTGGEPRLLVQNAVADW
ncbi:MAG: hypothetical protein ABJC39_07170 [Chloroflexota bacterium]